MVDQLWDDYEHHDKQLSDLWNTLKKFANKATHREKEAREVLKTVPGVGPVTVEVVLSEVGDFGHFRNAKAVCAYAGLAPSSARVEVKGPRIWASAKRARDCCVGLWWKRAGG